MHLSRISRRLRLALGTTALVTLAATGTVLARSAPPTLGRAVDSADEPCFFLFNSVVRNTCAQPKGIEIPLPIDNSGGKTVSISVATPNPAAGASQICCRAIGTDEAMTQTFPNTNSSICAGVSGPSTITLTGASVPSRGRLFASCNVGPGAIINTINWNQ